MIRMVLELEQRDENIFICLKSIRLQWNESIRLQWNVSFHGTNCRCGSIEGKINYLD